MNNSAEEMADSGRKTFGGLVMFILLNVNLWQDKTLRGACGALSRSVRLASRLGGCPAMTLRHLVRFWDRF